MGKLLLRLFPVLLAACLLAGCGLAGGSDSGQEQDASNTAAGEGMGTLNHFYYSYQGPGDAAALTYDLLRDGTLMVVTVWREGEMVAGFPTQFPAAALDDLDAVLQEHKVAEWDGFSGEGQSGSFVLLAEYQDGTVSASGEGDFPTGFEPANETMLELLAQIEAEAQQGQPTIEPAQ